MECSRDAGRAMDKCQCVRAPITCLMSMLSSESISQSSSESSGLPLSACVQAEIRHLPCASTCQNPLKVGHEFVGHAHVVSSVQLLERVPPPVSSTHACEGPWGERSSRAVPST